MAEQHDCPLHGSRRAAYDDANTEQETVRPRRSPMNARRQREAIAGCTMSRQQSEKEVDEHLAAGRVTVHDNADALLRHLDQLDAEAHDPQATAEPESS